jgi:ribosomal peptide maturation radical SAM protein 1
MHSDKKDILLVAMPFAGPAIPSIQLPILVEYLKERNMKISSRHLYLKAADIIGLKNYNFLISSPNDSYQAQMFFSKYVFPDYWNKNEEKFREYFNNKMSSNNDIKTNKNFDNYLNLIDEFYSWSLENLNWKSYDIIGFTLNYGQFLPSLAIAKRIKELDPEKNIIFGGSRTIDQIGINVLKTFDYIDFIVSGEGEEALFQLSSNFHNYKEIPHLIYRDRKEIIWNKSDEIIDINSLSIPSYDSFYDELSLTSEEIQQYYHLFGRLPVEISRGCWWNKCSFCNLNLQHKKYREKNVEKIVDEINVLSEKYKMLNFQIIGNALLKNDYRNLCNRIIELGKDFTFYVEARAGRMKSEDYSLLKKAGFTTIQTGIETFSQNYLKKMNKGVRIIDNIGSLKFCKENGILNTYNIIVNYPNEESIDFKETVKNTEFFWQYLDPPNISNLIVGLGSFIFNNIKMFNIKELKNSEIDKIMFPEKILQNNISNFYYFKRENENIDNNWEEFVTKWRKIREESETKVIKSKKLVDKLIFYFVDGGNFIKIYDKRSLCEVLIYVLDENEREIFLSCEDVISQKDLQEKLSHIPDYQIVAIIHSLEKSGILYQEDGYYLALPLNFCKCFGIDKKTWTTTEEKIIENKLTV